MNNTKFISGAHQETSEKVFSSDALEFVKILCYKFSPRIELLLEDRKKNPVTDFLEGTAYIRETDWKLPPPPRQIADRRVEITGPVDRKMIINALNSGAQVFMADFEDSNSPTWNNCANGQINLYDAVRGNIAFQSENGKIYSLNDKVARLFVRPRGLHLKEKSIVYDDDFCASASLFDFGVFAFNNAKYMVEQGEIPCFYLPKLESWKEAALWKDIFYFTESTLGIDTGTFKATVLVETFPLVFQMNEVIHALGEYSAGLNCGRWDYIFSFIKNHPLSPLPDRDKVTMGEHFMRSYTQLLVQTCHKRGVHAMGGMAAQIPVKGNPEKNERAMNKVYDDKLREVLDGHDGTWVAHPALIPVARSVFDEHMPSANQIHNLRRDINRKITKEDLSCIPIGPRTDECLRNNIRVGYEYMRNWLDGNGCVPLNNLMEDAATAEISRAQIWQWMKNEVLLDNGERLTRSYFLKVFSEEMENLQEDELCENIFVGLCLSGKLQDFLTTVCYEHI